MKKRVLRLTILACICSLFVPAIWADPQWVTQKYVFDIPESRADIGLNTFAEQARTQIIYDFDLVRTERVKSLKGSFSVQEAVKAILRDTCLEPKFKSFRPAGAEDQATGVISIMKNNKCSKMSVIKSVSLAILGAVVHAPMDANAAVESPKRTIEEVVVTARRTEEGLQTVPISVTAIGEQQLRSANIDSGNDLQRLVPTLNVQQNSLGPGHAYSLRGVRTGVVTYFNEVPTDSSAIDLQIWDLASVQALSGPQGTLFGKNSTGGAILFVPQAPGEEFDLELGARFGNYNERQYTAIVNIPISDTFKVRAGARTQKRDGVVDNDLGEDFQSQDRSSYRISALFEPVDWISNYTIYDYSERDEQPFPNITTALAVQPCPTGLLSCLYTQALLEEELTKLDTRKTRHPYIQGLDDERSGISNNLTVDLGDIKAKYLFGYRKGEFFHAKPGTSLPIPFIIGFNETLYDKRETHELQLLGSAFDDRIEWVTGVYMSSSESNTVAARVLFGAPGSGFELNNSYQSGGITEEESDAVYAQLTWKIGDVRLTGGARRTEDEQNVSQLGYSPGPVCNLPNIPGVDLAACRRNLSDTFSATTYNISIDYQVSSDLMVYATHRKGYNTGGFNTGIPDPELVSYDPEYITDYEIGLKAEWSVLDMPVRSNVSSFYANYEDIQRTTNVLRNGLSYVGQFNAAEATMYGLQSELIIKPTDNFTVSLAYGYLHTKYDSFDNVLIGNATGNKFAQAPEHTLNLSLSYARSVAAGGEVTGTAGYAYQDQITFVDANIDAPAAFQDGYGLVDLRLDWLSMLNSNFDVGLYVKNATDEEYALNILDQSNTFGFVSTVFADPRTYGLELRYYLK